MADDKVIAKLEEKANIVRKNIFRILEHSLSGHAGGTMSIVEIVTALYFHHLKLQYGNYDWPDRDRVVLSKAHCCECIYAVLPELGYVTEEALDTYNCYRSPFQGHADRWCTPGIDYSGGSLGQGLSFAVGLAMAEKIHIAQEPPAVASPGLLPRFLMRYNPRYRVFCITGDGECNEGQVWEAAMFANKYHLDNLINIVDYNKFSLDGPSLDIMPLEPFADKWRAFGWWVKEIDGHNLREIVDTLELANNLYGDGKPKCIIAHTVKGHGVPAWEETHTHLGRGDGILLGVKQGREIYGNL